MFEKVRKYLADYFSVDESTITKDTDIVEDLGADSLAVVELLFKMETEVGTEIDDEAVSSYTKVGDFVNYLEKLAKSKE